MNPLLIAEPRAWTYVLFERPIHTESVDMAMETGETARRLRPPRGEVRNRLSLRMQRPDTLYRRLAQDRLHLAHWAGMSERERSAGTPDFRRARHPSKTYRGSCEDGVFTVTVLDSALPQGDDNPRRLTPGVSRSLRDCSEYFCWGRGEAGSTQLAIALLLDVTGERDTALQWHELFTEKYVMKLSPSWTVPEIDIALWLYCFQNARPGA